MICSVALPRVFNNLWPIDVHSTCRSFLSLGMLKFRIDANIMNGPPETIRVLSDIPEHGIDFGRLRDLSHVALFALVAWPGHELYCDGGHTNKIDNTANQRPSE
jgi:hypothetical protein